VSPKLPSHRATPFTTYLRRRWELTDKPTTPPLPPKFAIASPEPTRRGRRFAPGYSLSSIRPRQRPSISLSPRDRPPAKRYRTISTSPSSTIYPTPHSMASARKRPRPESEENRAECPFSIKLIDPRDKERDNKKIKKRRRTENGGGEEEDIALKVNLQLSPFAPAGKFKTFETMDVHYQVEPAKKWTDMTRYNSFVRKFRFPRRQSLSELLPKPFPLLTSSLSRTSQRRQVLQRGLHIRGKRCQHRSAEGCVGHRSNATKKKIG
jgi:hypothetical protein